MSYHISESELVEYLLFYTTPNRAARMAREIFANDYYYEVERYTSEMYFVVNSNSIGGFIEISIMNSSREVIPGRTVRFH